MEEYKFTRTPDGRAIEAHAPAVVLPYMKATVDPGNAGTATAVVRGIVNGEQVRTQHEEQYTVGNNDSVIEAVKRCADWALTQISNYVSAQKEQDDYYAAVLGGYPPAGTAPEEAAPSGG